MSRFHLIWPFTALGGAAIGLYTLVVRGAVTIDLGWGRTVRPLGPITLQINAPGEIVFEIISAPYLGRTPRALQKKLRVIERGDNMVLAAHYTRAGWFTVTTVETVRFSPPDRIDFRLVRGPVPHVVEHFLLHEREGGCELEYSGELGADLWRLGRMWGNTVARSWEASVRTSLDSIRTEAERRASGR